MLLDNDASAGAGVRASGDVVVLQALVAKLKEQLQAVGVDPVAAPASLIEAKSNAQHLVEDCDSSFQQAIVHPTTRCKVPRELILELKKGKSQRRHAKGRK